MLETSSFSPLTRSLGSPTQGLVPPTVAGHFLLNGCNQDNLPLACLEAHLLSDPRSYEVDN